jgi:hypothetical protein
MVLINMNTLNVKEHRMLKCLERKKDSFNVIVIPLSKPVDRIDQYDKDNIEYTDDKEQTVIESKHSKKK